MTRKARPASRSKAKPAAEKATPRKSTVDPKPGSTFEQLVGILLGGLAAAGLGKAITVQRNLTLQGKTTRHEIDVFWRLRAGQVTYNTVIQAKDWVKPVDQGEVLKLKGVLDDLPNQPRGLIVSKAGFQKGAKRVARANGVLLLEVSPLSPQFAVTMTRNSIAIVRIANQRTRMLTREGNKWMAGRPLQRIIRITILTPKALHLHIHASERLQAGTLPRAESADLFIVQPGRGSRISIASLVQEGLGHAARFGAKHRAASWIFKPNAFLETRDGSPVIHGVWALEASFDVDITKSVRPMTSRQTVDYIIRNVLSRTATSVRVRDTDSDPEISMTQQEQGRGPTC